MGQYKVIERGKSNEEFQNEINKLGAQGWRVAHFSTHDSGGMFKAAVVMEKLDPLPKP